MAYQGVLLLLFVSLSPNQSTEEAFSDRSTFSPIVQIDGIEDGSIREVANFESNGLVPKPSYPLGGGYIGRSFPAQPHTVTSILKTNYTLNQPRKLLKFIFSGPGCQPNPASLTIHLHHTQAKVQLQGGSKMPDDNIVTVWFIENFLRERFVRDAKDRKFDIDNINSKIKAIEKPLLRPSTSSSVCSHCQKKFTPSSKPIPCSMCAKFKHKTKCLGSCPSLKDGTSNNPGKSLNTTSASYAAVVAGTSRLEDLSCSGTNSGVGKSHVPSTALTTVTTFSTRATPLYDTQPPP